VNEYKNYTVQDFDKDNCLKISKTFYLTLLFVLRGYLVWLMSVTNMRDRVVIIEWIYPETSLFFISLLSGAAGLFVVLILLLRRPEAPLWVKKLWPYCRIFLIVALLFDLFVNFIAYFYWQYLSMSWLVIQTTLVISLALLCFKSKKLTLNLKEFPERLVDD
jgi:lysylphosphatidylglycerol synthetase-like protein (DUF2156 family)